MYSTDALPGEVAFLGVVVGTSLFALWVLPSFLVLAAIDAS